MPIRHPGGALLALAVLVMSAAPARADNYPIRDGTGAMQTFCSKLWTGVQHPCHVMMGMFGSQPTAIAVDGSGNVGVNVQSSALPTGGSTAAKQDTGNASLSSIDGKLTGVATAAGQATESGKLDTVHVDVQAVITALGTPFQAGGSIGNTWFGARLQDASGVAFGTSGNPVVTSLPGSATSANQATEIAALASLLTKLSADPATQTTLAAVLAKLSADPASQTTLAAVLAKLSSDPATQTTAAAILAKLSADPSTGAKQDAAKAVLDTIHADHQDTRTAAANITAADVGTTSTPGQNGVNQITGTPTANSSLTWAVNGQSSVAITVTNTFSAACTIETSADAAATYVASTAKQLGTGSTSSSVTGDGTFRVDVTGATNVRLRCPTFTSGTLSAYATASPAPGLTQILNPVPLMGTDGLTKASLSNGIAAAQAFATVSTSAVTGTLVSSTLTAAFTPPTPRGSYLELTGTGTAAAVTVEFLCNDGTTYAAEVLGTDGGTPTVMNDVAYNGGVRNGVRIPIEVSRAGQVVKVLPGAVTGTVNFAFVPGN